MSPDTVDEMLSKYRLCLGKSEHLRIEINILRKRVENLRDTAMTDTALTGLQYTGMPHGSGVSDVTGRVAVRFADGYKPQYVLENEQDLRNLEEEKSAADAVILFVGGWLNALNERERFVIEQKDCNGQTWAKVTDEFCKQFGMAYSKEGIKRIHDKAKRKIYLIAS